MFRCVTLRMVCLVGGCLSASCGQGTTGSESTLGNARLSPRAGVIAAAQRSTGQDYAVRVDADALRAKAGNFSVSYDARGVHLESGRGEPAASGGHVDAGSGTLSLRRIGCAGAMEGAAEVTPSFDGNRVVYARWAGTTAVEEWYLTGPMGLEQGFTVAERPACAVRRHELVLEVLARELAVRADGDALVLEGIWGQRYRYSDLFARDATGRALPARLEASKNGRITLRVDITRASFPVEVDPLVWAQDTKLLAADAAAGDAFGRSVVIDGDTALVGADLKGFSGGAYVFVRSGTTWTQQQELLPVGSGANDIFGYAVALSGDTALVGAAWADDQGTNSGAAYVFTRSGTSWTEQQKLLASDGAAGDSFGASVALSGDTALVGAYMADAQGTDSGAVYVFTRSGTSWTEQQKLLASDGAGGKWFSSALALSSDTALVGAQRDGEKGASSGAVYVFTSSGTTWSQSQKLLASDATGSENFGISVALSGDSALVGAALDNAPAGQSGSAYVFTRSGTTWTQQQKLVAADGATGDRFGSSVALSGDSALVGAYRHDDKGTDSGGAYVFTRSVTTWTQQQELLADDGAAADQFGYSVALNSDTLLVGAFGNDIGGSVYVFALKKSDGDPCSLDSECASNSCQGGSCQPSGTGGAGGTAGAAGSGGTGGTSVGGTGGTSVGGTGGISSGGTAGAPTGGSAGASSGGSNASGGSSAGGAGGASGSSNASSGDEGGCGCRTTSGQQPLRSWLLLLFGVASLCRRRAQRVR